jgi:hypothetical protein
MLLCAACGRIRYEPQGGNPCWTPDGGDLCTEPPPPEESCALAPTPLPFADDLDPEPDGELLVIWDPMTGAGSGSEDCATLVVPESRSYRLYATEWSESGTDQLDESGYLTISNRCNPEGFPEERNVGDRYVVLDSDNEPGAVRERSFLGTFLLVAGEPNRICLHHFCHDYVEALAGGLDLGFTNDGCRSLSSLHFETDSQTGCALRAAPRACR